MIQTLFTALILSLAWALPAAASDYAREKKWADEIVPGIVVGDPVYLETPRGHHKFLTLFTPAGPDQAVIVVHGLGIHPDWGLIGNLRSELADRGYTTLSIQMPVLAADAKSEDYAPTFPEASERIAAAVDFLKARGYSRLAIVSHSLGSRMSLEYLQGTPDPAVLAWASLGIVASDDFEKFKLPVLNLYGGNDSPHVLKGAATRSKGLTAAGSKQVVIKHADHFFTGHEKEMVDAVADFLAATLK
jgi:pimeloyl-ACP methyl ester carboxylesterase